MVNQYKSVDYLFINYLIIIVLQVFKSVSL